nr:MAG TPA: HTH-type transcriptional regulator [Caudoviricetes sp.]
MKLTKDEVALLDKDPKGLLVRAYKLHYPEMSTREVAKRVGLSKTQVHRIFAQDGTPDGTPNGTADGTAKPAPLKGKLAKRGTPNGTPDGTPDGTKRTTLTALLKPIFESFFKSKTNMDFVWSAKEMKSLKDFGEKLRASIKAKDNPHDDEHIASALPIFLSKIDDPWVLSHLSPSILNSKYNELISHISRQRTLTRAEERQQAGNAIEVLRAGAMSVLQR